MIWAQAAAFVLLGYAALAAFVEGFRAWREATTEPPCPAVPKQERETTP